MTHGIHCSSSYVDVFWCTLTKNERKFAQTQNPSTCHASGLPQASQPATARHLLLLTAVQILPPPELLPSSPSSHVGHKFAMLRSSSPTSLQLNDSQQKLQSATMRAKRSIARGL
eukprot:745959-Hanusia_phi.AAC.4